VGVGAGLFFLMVLFVGTSLLIPICRGCYPNLESGKFKFRFEKVIADSGEEKKSKQLSDKHE
jgi:hypothetical protein